MTRRLVVPKAMIADMDGLEMVISGLERVTGGGKINYREAVVIESENVPAMWMIHDLLLGRDAPAELPGVIDPLKAIPAPVPDDAAAPVPRGRAMTLGKQKAKIEKPRLRPAHVKSYTVAASGEKMNGQAVKGALRRKALKPGSRLHHPKLGNLVVSPDYELVKG